MAGSSKTYATTVSKHNLVSAVNVSNFVSVKLHLKSEYKIWKAQILCLIESQELVHIINAHGPSLVDDEFLDHVLKGWILSTLSEPLLEYIGNFGRHTAREVWLKLESIFDPPTSKMKEGDPAQNQDDEYRRALCVIISTFVLVKLYGRKNYDIWKAQMLCIIEREKLLHIINAEYPYPENKGVHMISKYDKLVKGWIFTTMDHQLVEDFIDYSTVQSIWKQLESRFNRPINYREEGDSVDVSALREDPKYIQVSNLNVSNFVSVKLSGHINYFIWKSQMLCLFESQELLHIIEIETNDPNDCGPMTKKYEYLLLRWILGTMNDLLLETFTKYNSVQLLWKKLESEYNSPKSESDIEEERDIESFLVPQKKI